MNARKKVILITGSSGLIGRPLAQRLAGDFDAIGLDREEPLAPPPSAECVSIDLSSDESMQRALGKVRERHGEHIASIIHLATYYDFSGEPNPNYEEVNVRGTGRLLCALQDFEVGQFIFASTLLVHAPCPVGQHIDEAWPLEPKWDYPKSKIEAEQLIRAERGAIPAVLLRIASVYDDRCHSPPLAHQIQRIYERKLVSYVFPGDVSHGQAYLHLSDLLDAFLLLVQRRMELPPELPLLIGEPDTLSYDELQCRLGRLIHDEGWETREIPKSLAKAGAWLEDAMPLGEEPFLKPWMIDLTDDHYALDISRARALLGWEPKRSLRDTLPKMVDALKADPLGWYRENKLEPPAWLQETAGYDRRRPKQVQQKLRERTSK